MTYSRRRFMQWAASMSALAVAGPKGTRLVQVADGCIEKLDPALLHSQIQVFARLLHGIETMTASQLKGGA